MPLTRSLINKKGIFIKSDNKAKKANASLFSIFSIIAVLLLIAATWQMLNIARNIYLGMIQGKTASVCSVDNDATFYKPDKTRGQRLCSEKNNILRKIIATVYLAAYNLENVNNKTNSALHERKAIDILKRYARAQEIYRQHYGKYAQKTSELIIKKNGQFLIIDPEIKVLNWAFNKKRAVDGYYYITTIKEVSEQVEENFFLCAVPAEYKASGLNTFCIDSRAIIFKKDNQGKPVFEKEAIDASWERLSKINKTIKERSRK